MNALISLPIVAAPTSAPAMLGVDPVHGAIERHARAAEAVRIMTVELKRLFAVVDDELGPSDADVSRNELRVRRLDELAGGDIDAVGQEHFDEEVDAMEALSETTPTTLDGLLAVLIYVGKAQRVNYDFLPRERCEVMFNKLARAAETLKRTHLA